LSEDDPRREVAMGKLVNFERRKPAHPHREDHSQSAEILIFTGVRYERGSPVTPTKPTTSSRTKRKRV
jgi:hypothetical protein